MKLNVIYGFQLLSASPRLIRVYLEVRDPLLLDTFEDVQDKISDKFHGVSFVVNVHSTDAVQQKDLLHVAAKLFGRVVFLADDAICHQKIAAKI